MGSMDNDNVEVVNLNIIVGAGGVGSKPQIWSGLAAEGLNVLCDLYNRRLDHGDVSATKD